jgi:hypothetical protein
MAWGDTYSQIIMWELFMNNPPKHNSSFGWLIFSIFFCGQNLNAFTTLKGFHTKVNMRTKVSAL